MNNLKSVSLKMFYGTFIVGIAMSGIVSFLADNFEMTSAMRGFFKTFPLLAFLVFSILFLCFWLYALIFTLNRWDERTIGQNLLYLAMTIIFGGFWGCYCVHQTPDSENEEAKKM